MIDNYNVPDGYVLVPETPTDEQLKHGAKVKLYHEDGGKSDIGRSTAGDVYREMVQIGKDEKPKTNIVISYGIDGFTLYDALRSMNWEDKKLAVIEYKDLPLGVQTYSGKMLDDIIVKHMPKSDTTKVLGPYAYTEGEHTHLSSEQLDEYVDRIKSRMSDIKIHWPPEQVPGEADFHKSIRFLTKREQGYVMVAYREVLRSTLTQYSGVNVHGNSILAGDVVHACKYGTFVKRDVATGVELIVKELKDRRMWPDELDEETEAEIVQRFTDILQGKEPAEESDDE